MFENLIREWFAEVWTDYNAFVKALLMGDVGAPAIIMWTKRCSF